MKKNVAVVYGGDSSEYKISILSGKYVARSISRDKYEVYEVFVRGARWCVVEGGTEEIRPIADIDKSDFSCVLDGRRIHFDVAYITIHGTPGENGLMQGYLQMLGIPCTTCDAHVASVIFDKCSCKRFLSSAGINMSKDVYLQKGDRYDVAEILAQLRLPVFVKPVIGGSSFGVTKVKKAEDLQEAILNGFKEGDALIIEEGIKGRELTEGVFRNGDKIVPLPVTEIVPEGEYFDYEAKYLGKSKELCPAPIPEELAAEIGQLSSRIYKYLGCNGLVRIDYIWDGRDIWFLELNVTPGMTQMSIVPAQVREAGIDIADFLDILISGAR